MQIDLFDRPKKIIAAKSLNDISSQRDRMISFNRDNAAELSKNRKEEIIKAASRCRITRGLSVFSENKEMKSTAIVTPINQP